MNRAGFSRLMTEMRPRILVVCQIHTKKINFSSYQTIHFLPRLIIYNDNINNILSDLLNYYYENINIFK